MKPFRRLTKSRTSDSNACYNGWCKNGSDENLISTATLAALIGAGGLGDLILLGIDRNNASLILLGAIPAALLAIIFDLILRFMAKLSYKKLLMTLGVIVMIIILAIAIPMFAKGDKITLAGKLGSEPSIITNMYKILIEEETKNTVEVKNGMGKQHFYLML
ncbi:hypothetical protein ACVPOS_07730 [Staphylococcus aureus]